MVSLKVRFVDDAQSLAKIIAFTAKSIQLDKFAQGNYVVLPKLLAGKRKSVYFPDLGYTSEFWSQLANLKDYSLTKPYPEYCLEFIQTKLVNYKAPDTHQLIASWNTNVSDYKNHLNTIFSQDLLKKVSNIDILLTEFGTPGSFSRTSSRGGAKQLICTARTDFGPENILQVLVNCLITITQPGYADVGTIGWYQRNAIINYISKYSSLSPLLPGYKEDVYSDQISTESANYLANIGFPKPDTINTSSLTNKLTPQERRLWLCLSDQTGHIVTFDTTAVAVWGDQADEKFSLYALAKIIESLRQKIKSEGINRELIHTHRKQGYQLLI